MGPFHCAICRRTDFSGKGHIYGKSHQSKLKVVLVKFLEKVKEARRSIRSPQVVKYDASVHDEMMWCYCCEMEVQKHACDNGVAVLHGCLLEHFSTREHRTNTHSFWWKNKADQKLREKFIITEQELERFKAEVPKALEDFTEREDASLKEKAAVFRSQERHRLELLQSLTEPDPELQNSVEAERQSTEQTSCMSRDALRDFSVGSNRLTEQAGPSRDDPVLQTQWLDEEHGLTFIGYQDSSGSGNVHTGAVPPWLLDEPEDVSAGPSCQIGPSLPEFLKHKEQEKLKKLPPNRVGANFDHGSYTDANWLPSFGRVWNSGRRWQSRRQFREEENGGRRKRKRQRGDGAATKKTKELRSEDVETVYRGGGGGDGAH